jgi:glutathione synthase/RimK-type ligase-like ATP-grasp enzyme
VWYRRPGTPTAHADVTDPAVRTFIEQECATFVRDLWSSLDALWLPGKPTLVRDGALKASQLKLAGELGFELPPTLVSNSPDDVVDFYRRHGGRIVSKCEGHGLIDAFDQRFVRYTELVSPRDIAHARAIRHCPMIFQAYVDKRVELRITVVGRRVFAAEIHSQVTNHTKTDWRHYDLGRTPHLPHALPADVERRCLALVERMGLCYGAIDMILTPDGRYVFVEINPNGQYLWIEQTTGLPISDAICDLLVAGAPDASALDEPFASIGGAS